MPRSPNLTIFMPITDDCFTLVHVHRVTFKLYNLQAFNFADSAIIAAMVHIIINTCAKTWRLFKEGSGLINPQHMCHMVMVLCVCVCVSITKLAAMYLVYMSKAR